MKVERVYALALIGVIALLGISHAYMDRRPELLLLIAAWIATLLLFVDKK